MTVQQIRLLSKVYFAKDEEFDYFRLKMKKVNLSSLMTLTLI